jgi:hypothetical protein
MSVELKVKSKHLSEEARIIRFEERKQLKQFEWAKRKHYATGSNDTYPYWNDIAWRNYYNLNSHRRKDVRNENRATFLPRVVNMVAKYGNNKMPLKVYDREKRNYVENPDLATLRKKIVEWATFPA